MSVHIVTGAFGYSGRYIAARLLAEGVTVRALTDSPNRPHFFGDKIAASPFNFDRPEKLVTALEGAEVLYNTYVDTVGVIIGKRRPVVSVSPMMGNLAVWALGKLVGDVRLTREEIVGLMQNLLYTTSKPTGTIKLSEWAQAHASELGVRYASEMAHRRKRDIAYGD